MEEGSLWASRIGAREGRNRNQANVIPRQFAPIGVRPQGFESQTVLVDGGLSVAVICFCLDREASGDGYWPLLDCQLDGGRLRDIVDAGCGDGNGVNTDIGAAGSGSLGENHRRRGGVAGDGFVGEQGAGVGGQPRHAPYRLCVWVRTCDRRGERKFRFIPVAIDER